MTETARQIVLASRPVGEPTLDNFRLPAGANLQLADRPQSAAFEGRTEKFNSADTVIRDV
jgi:hypothetical protein